MKYFMQTTPDPNAPLVAPDPSLYAEMGKLIEDGFRDGTLIATGALHPIVTKIEHHNGSFTLTDGPFTEAKEAVVGWALVEVGSFEEALDMSKKFWRIVGDGSGLIQRVLEPGEQPDAGA